MPKRPNRRIPMIRKKKRARKNNANVTQKTSLQGRLALIAEVKKYPILCTSLDVDEDSETCFGAWEKIAEALQIVDSTYQTPMDCIKIWKSIKRSFVSYIKYDIHKRGADIRAMQRLFPDFNEENLLVTAEDSDENVARNISSEVGSDTAKEKMHPETNHTAVRKTLRYPPRELLFALIAEVDKYPILCTTLDVDGNSETWVNIAEALQIDDSMSTSPVDYCRKIWKLIQRTLNRVINGEVRPTNVGKPRLDQFPERYENSGEDDAMNNSSEVRSDTAENNAAVPEPQPNQAVTEFERTLIAEVRENPVIFNSFYKHVYWENCYNAWEKITEALNLKTGADENNELNNSSEVGSATAESAEKIIPPTTNDAAVPEPQQLKKKLYFITKQLLGFTCSDGRCPILAFMVKPSKALYPEYYEVIDEPIDMITIEANIKNDRYNVIEEMISDYRLMFSNCRYFNEEGSVIYENASLLERVMNEKLEELNCTYKKKTPSKPIQADTEFLLALIAEVKKYPVISKSLYEDIYTRESYTSWKKIAEVLQFVAGYSAILSRNINYCRNKWLFIIESFIRYNSGDPYTPNEAVMQVMQSLYPDGNELICDSASESDCQSDESYQESRPKKRTAAPPAREPMCEGADENNELNNSSEVGSATTNSASQSQSAEEIIPPTTNDAAVPEPQQAATPGHPRSIGARQTERAVSFAIIDHLFDSLHSPAARTDVCNSLIQLLCQYQQAATPGHPRSIGARQTERAVSFAIIDHLFDSLHSPAARTDVCNSLIQLLCQYQQAATPGHPRSIGARQTERAVSFAIIDHLFDSLHSPAARTDVCNSLIQLLCQYQPNVLSDIIEYGARQTDYLNINWSGLPIPEDLCHEIWRRDVDEKLRKAHKISPSKRRPKKEK